MSDKHYDIIVIGAGLGGLTAAAVLAKRKKVLLLEKNAVAGGYVVNFKKEGFDFDVALDAIDGLAEGGLPYNILKKCDALGKIETQSPEYLYRTIFPDFDFRIPQRKSLTAYTGILTGYFPSETRGIGKVLSDMSKIFKEGDNFFRSQSRLWQKIIRFPFKYPTVLRYGLLTLETMLNTFIKDYRLKALLSQSWQYFGLPPSKLSAFYYSYPMIDFFINGANCVKGGGQALSNAFLNALLENGGEVLFAAPAEKIILSNNKAVGVHTTKGYFFAENIISGIDADKTFLNLIGQDKIKKSFVKRLNRLQPSASAFVVCLGLNIDLKEIGITDYEIFFHPDYDLEKHYLQCLNNELDKTSFFITINSNVTQERKNSQLKIAVLSGYDFWSKLNKQNYEQKKLELADILIKRVEKIIPNLSSYIEVKEIITPLTLERYCGNKKGAIYGYDQLVSQSGLFRLSPKTPIKNLYLAGAWTQPGGGISTVIISGNHIAEEILRKR